jgi:hypothetical protein
MSSKNLIGRIKDYPWYTLLFAVYPTVTLLAHNLGEVEYDAAIRVLWVSGLFSVTLVLFFHFLYRDLNKAGILTTLLLFGFFFYGHFFGYLRGLEVNGLVIGRHTYFMVVWLGLLLWLAWGIQRASKVVLILPSFLSVMTVVLLVLPVLQIASHRYKAWQNGRQVSPPEISLAAQPIESYPDIYFIILDMYGRHDVLFDEFAYDDSAFLQELQNMGFYVAQCSQSNYPSTAFSLSSALNINYLTDISDVVSSQNTNSTILWHLIQNNAVEQTLKDLGYKTVAFETSYRWTELQNAEYYYTLHSSGITDFENLLLKNSFTAVFFELGLLDEYRLTSDQRKYDLSIHVLDELEKIPSIAGPKFVFAHLTIPHPPFVIGPDGELEIIPPHYEGNESYYVEDEYKIGYINQVTYLNSRMPQVLGAILAKSKQPPIIILQGDHGPRFVEMEQQLDILNAYYFPEPQPELHSFLSPVNNFRIIFNTYFGASLPLLPDRSYSVGFETPYDFKEISNKCPID